MKILGLIPARGGSKGVPRKNIRLLNGKPLIDYTILAGQQSNLITKLIVSSEDEEIINHSLAMNVSVPFQRPERLATDESPTIDTIIHAINYFESKGEYFDAVCLLQATSPFRSTDFIDRAIRKFKEANSDSLVSVTQVPHQYNPHWVFEENDNSLLEISTKDDFIIARRQELPKAFIRDGSIYITKTKVLKEYKNVLGKKIAYIVSDFEPIINIDTQEDWTLAEDYLKNKLK
ncbi:acylneuraminate cytidylyltransferase family protein [Urechidicola sp. KH5]